MNVTRRKILLGVVGLAGIAATYRYAARTRPVAASEAFLVTHSEDEWRHLLTPAQYNVLREQGTEAPGSSPLLDEHRTGTFACAGCDLPLFSSTTKYDSGTGWPSFWQPLQGAVRTSTDSSLLMQRTEVHCARCGGHLGHVFNDGPPPTGLRYCMNGTALQFHLA
jgi:peptide-methionine (R)-S-oxide reductase